MIFNEVRQKINEREQLLKKRISDMLDSEQILFKQRIQNLRDQIRCIKDVKSEKFKIEAEVDLVVLLKAKLRHDLQLEANKAVENYPLKNSLPEINRNDEIACIVKQILPKKLRPSLLSSTLTSQIRTMTQRENTRKKEIQNNKKEIDVLLYGGSNAKSGANSQIGQYQDIPEKSLSVAKNMPRKISKDRLMSHSSLSTKVKSKVKRNNIESLARESQEAPKRRNSLSSSPKHMPTQQQKRLSPLKEEPEGKRGQNGTCQSFTNQRLKPTLLSGTNHHIFQRAPTSLLKQSEREKKLTQRKKAKKKADATTTGAKS